MLRFEQWKNRVPRREPFTEPLADEEREQVTERAYAIWKARQDDGKSLPEDDWNEAIEQLRAEQAFPGARAKRMGKWIWQQTGLKNKTLWDLLQLLVIPITLAFIGYGLQEFSKQRDQQIADDKANQETLVKYLDEISELLNDGLLKSTPDSEKVIIAQAKTVAALQSLNAKRQSLVIQFLEAVNLNNLNKYGLLHKARLAKADFTSSDLSGVVLIGADLREAKIGCPITTKEPNKKCSNLSGANLNSADFRYADLKGADLRYTDLKGADFRYADLRGANLEGAILDGAMLDDAMLDGVTLLYAQLRGASLDGADLRSADLYGAILEDADLQGANFEDAILRGANLKNANLNGAILFQTILDYGAKGINLASTPNILFCRTQLPVNIRKLSDRDCDKLPQVLFNRYRVGIYEATYKATYKERYEDKFKELDEAKRYVENARKQQR